MPDIPFVLRFTLGHEMSPQNCPVPRGRGKSGPALGGTEYRLMPSVCRLIVRAKLWNLQFRYLVSRAPVRRRSIVVVSGVLLKMEVGIRKRAWQRAWRYPAYLWSLRWVYAVKKTPEVGIRPIPAYTPQYTTDSSVVPPDPSAHFYPCPWGQGNFGETSHGQV